MKTPSSPRTLPALLFVLVGLLVSIQLSFPNFASADVGELLSRTQVQITYQGSATLSNTLGVSQEIQIQQPSIDFGPFEPIMWDINVENSSGLVIADINWIYSATSPSIFGFSLSTGSQAKPNNGGAICYSSPSVYCTNTPPSWTLSDPIRVSFLPDLTNGDNWWNASITDLKTGTKLDLGSIKEVYSLSTTKVEVQDAIYRSSITDDCPADAAPVADTYFGPVFDTAGGLEMHPNPTITTHACANAAYGTLINYIGGYLLYGGSKASIQSSPRADPFVPSTLIPSATPPIPDTPTDFLETAANGVVTFNVQVPTLQSKGVTSVYLVSPELGFQQTNPINTTLTGSTAEIEFPVLPGFVNKPINLSFYASNGYFVSDPLTTVITIPQSALAPVQIPVAQGSHTVPTGVTNAPAVTTKIPALAQDIKTSVIGNQLIITAKSAQKTGAAAIGALLVSAPFKFTSAIPGQGTISSGKIQFKFALNKSLSGKTIPFAIYLYNKLGVSGGVSGKVKLP